VAKAKPTSEEVGVTIGELERIVILGMLAVLDGNRKATAEALGIQPRTLRDKIRKYKKQGYKPEPPKRGVKTRKS